MKAIWGGDDKLVWVLGDDGGLYPPVFEEFWGEEYRFMSVLEK
jgi:hypothetical protein